jgi:flagellar basal-body rod modification protein FlgD
MATTAPVTSSPTPVPPSATSGTAASSAATSSTANGADPTGALNFTQNFDTFLTLLTTQLKNQDPLSPMDTSQFTNQLVAFSQVEQQIKTNSQLATLISDQSTSQVVSALPMVGRTMEYNGNQTVLHGSQATFSYTLPSGVASATVAIQDASGNTVVSAPVDASAGKHSFSWNGQTSNGQQLPDGGTYTMQVLAVDANNASVTATTTATGTITGVSVNNNVATFDVSGVQVPMSQLVKLVTPSSTTASN